MSLNRYAKKVDENHAEIVRGLLRAGFSVQVLSAPACPDLLVGAAKGTARVNVLLEIKADPKKRMTGGQLAWASCWQGAKPYRVHSLDEAIAAVRAELAMHNGEP